MHTLDKFIEQIKQALGDQLVSATLYGSAAAGDYAGKSSDYNVLITTKTLNLSVLKKLATPTAAWTKSGNPPPLLFTPERLQRSADVFPIELLDIQDSRKILYGPDPLEGIEIDHANLRLQVEHELKGRLIQLRRAYLETQGRSRAVRNLLTDSYSSTCILLRAALRLFAKEIPAHKQAAVKALAQHIDFDPVPFDAVKLLRTENKSSIEVNQLFDQYIQSIEQVSDAVDAVEP